MTVFLISLSVNLETGDIYYIYDYSIKFSSNKNTIMQNKITKYAHNTVKSLYAIIDLAIVKQSISFDNPLFAKSRTCHINP